MDLRHNRLFEDLRGDARQWARFGPCYRRLGFWIGATYRFEAWAHGLPAGVPRQLLRGLGLALTAPVRLLKDVHLSPSAAIGPGLVMLHPHAIYVAPGTLIGANCDLFHDVTLGRGPVPGVPALGESVTVYPGARVLGGVKVGDRTEIGPNAVVTRDVPRGSVVAAAPSRAIPGETATLVTSVSARAARSNGSHA